MSKYNKEWARRYYLKHKAERDRYGKKWRSENRKLHHKYTKKWRSKSGRQIKNYSLKLKYGISIEEYDNLLLKQNGKCAICETVKNSVNRALAVDHNHKTNRVRGLLCDKCNDGIGRFNDSVELLEKAKKYLKEEK